MTVQAWFSSSDIDVVPGATAVLSLTVANLGKSTESFALSPAGLAAGWTTIRPGYVTLFGGSEETVDVEVRPPRLPSTTAGPVSLAVRMVPQADPDDVTTAETTLHIAPTFDRTINMLQPALRTRRRAVFELMLENQGNSQASCRLHLIDPSHRIEGDFDPPAVGVEPGGTTLIRLKVRASKRQWERRSRSIPFKVEADQQSTPTVTGRATLVQAPMIPERLLFRIFSLLVLAGALTGAWFGVVKPYIDRSADRAVADREPEPPATTVPGQVTIVAPTTAPADEEDVPATTIGPGTLEVNFTLNLPTAPEKGTQESTDYTVPTGSTLDLTDILIQNTFGDQGVISMRVGNIPLAWNMINLEGIDGGVQFRTPIHLLPGEKVTVETTCNQPGQDGAATCLPIVVIGGVLRPVAPTVGATTSTEA